MRNQGNKVFVGMSPKENSNFLKGQAGGFRKTVFVGLSGGVDSSVSAALLIDAGYQVTGVFIKVWQPSFYECTWKEDRLDAMRVCAKLQIPFVTLDLEKEYKKDVVDYMVSEYKLGRTPNPDVMCNKYIKFGAFFDWAMNHGADFVATGHYARVVKPKTLNMKCLKSNAPCFTLHVSCDLEKDQTYFLWTLTQKQLSKTLFPVGGMKKQNVRKLAKKFNLPTADKKDSQGLCFIGKINMKDFLGHYVKSERGNVLNQKGEIVGHHNGALFFTIGERHGFTVTKKTSKEERLYVVSKNLKSNTITVSPLKTEVKESSNLKMVTLEQTNWITGNTPIERKTYFARIRYRQELQKCEIVEQKKGHVAVRFSEEPTSLALGQSLVIYDENVCLGGGIIGTSH